jgi:hypothetical protein
VSGDTDLERMLATLMAHRRPGTFAYVTFPAGDAPEIDLQPSAVIVEDEGTTLVLDARAARAAGFTVGSEWVWLSLGVHSSLEAVGLTAAVAGALAGAGIPANVLAAFHHDHVLVPPERADEALEALQRLRDHAG